MITLGSFPRWVAASLLAGVLCTGCQPQSPVLKTGTVDTTVLLQADDEYQDFAQEYFAERVASAEKVREIVASQGGEVRDQATLEKLRAIESELLKKWQDRTREFTQSRMDRISAAAQVVARKKGLHLVLIDAKDYATVEFGAVDVTGDILAEMPGFAGAGPEPTGTTQSPEASR